LGPWTNFEKVLSAVVLGAALTLVGACFTVACSSSTSGAPSLAEPQDSGPSQSDAVSDAGTPAEDVGPCEPGSVSGFAPTPVAPLVQAACSDTNDIPQFVADCYSDAGTEQSCVSWQLLPANFICNAQCLNTSYSETNVSPGGSVPKPQPSWGPTVAVYNPGESDWLNVGGCVGVADTSQEGQACATALTNSFECEYYACASVRGCSVPVYPAPAQPVLKALQMCFAAAGSGVCASFTSAVNGACALNGDAGDAGPAAFCFKAASDNGALTTMLTQECGGGDGGGYTN
jgi:hypothetical protein